MKVALIKIPFEEQEFIKFSEKWAHIEDEYIGIGIVETILLECGADVFNIRLSSIDSCCDEVKELDPDVVMISVMQSSARLSLRFIEALRESGFCGKIFIGGWFPKTSWKEILTHNWPVDYVCFTDAEECLPQWYKNPGKDIFGIATYNNWDKQHLLKSSAIKLVPRYISPVRREGRHTYSIEMSRGCPHSRCTFCSQSCGNLYWDKWHPFQLEDVRNEIIKIHENFGNNCFATSDDDLLGHYQGAILRAKEIKRMVKTLPFSITFSASISVKAACSEEILDILQEAGLKQICVGFESGDARQLRRYGKEQSLEENYKAAENLSKRDLQVLPGLITFDPYSTVESIKKNLYFLFDHLKHYNISKLTKKLHLLTGSPFIKLCRHDNLLLGDYMTYDYKFRDESVAQIYKVLQKYTSMVKNLEGAFKDKGNDMILLLQTCHRNAVDHILESHAIDNYVNNQIARIESILYKSNNSCI